MNKMSEDMETIIRALGAAEGFMSGFEGDETQETLDDDLEEVRKAQDIADAMRARLVELENGLQQQVDAGRYIL